jgi:hypothetical protein
MDLRLRLELTGTTPMLLKNPRMADPDEPFVQEINKITAKGKRMTEDDRRTKERLQWMAALYIDEGRVVVPTANVRKCLIDSGKTGRKGTAIAQAVTFTDLFVPLAYDGPSDPRKLWEDATFRHRTMVNANPSSGKKSMVPSVRPRFYPWAVVVDVILLENVLDLADLQYYADRAGQAIGLGDGRTIGFGRFTVVIKQL